MKRNILKLANSISYGFQRVLKDQRFLTLALFLICGAIAVFAADPFTSATGEISKYKEPVKNLMRAIAAVVALVGAFNVFHKMTNGDQDVKKTIMMTLGGCIAFVALAETLPAFFE